MNVDGECAARFEESLVTPVAQGGHQRVHRLLQERLSTGHLYQRTSSLLHRAQAVLDRALLAFVEGVLRVAPYAPQMAARQTDEEAGSSGVSGFPLNRKKELVDEKLSGSEALQLWWKEIGAQTSAVPFGESRVRDPPSPRSFADLAGISHRNLLRHCRPRPGLVRDTTYGTSRRCL